jgi:hypothetical protein
MLTPGDVMGRNGAHASRPPRPIALTCSSTIGGAYSTKPPDGIGTVTKIAFTSCTGGGFTLAVTAHGLPWKATATSSGASTEKGKLSGISLKGSGDGCSAEIDGTSSSGSNGVVQFSYTFSSGALKFLTTGGNLHVYDSTGCHGVINDGDSVTLGGSYKIKAA